MLMSLELWLLSRVLMVFRGMLQWTRSEHDIARGDEALYQSLHSPGPGGPGYVLVFGPIDSVLMDH